MTKDVIYEGTCYFEGKQYDFSVRAPENDAKNVNAALVAAGATNIRMKNRMEIGFLIEGTPEKKAYTIVLAPKEGLVKTVEVLRSGIKFKILQPTETMLTKIDLIPSFGFEEPEQNRPYQIKIIMPTTLECNSLSAKCGGFQERFPGRLGRGETPKSQTTANSDPKGKGKLPSK